LSTDSATDGAAGGAPVVTGTRLRAGRAGSAKGAVSMVREAITVARAAGVTGQILVSGDSAYGVIPGVGACLKAGVGFSVALAKQRTVNRAIGGSSTDRG
jgi:hypothetical protein